MILPTKTYYIALFLTALAPELYASEQILSPIIKTKVIKKSPVIVRKNKHQQPDHFSVDITPPNSPEYLARAQVTHDQKNSCSIKVITRPQAAIMNILADQLRSKKIDTRHAPQISVELYNLNNDNNSELNKFMVNFFQSKLSPEALTESTL